MQVLAALFIGLTTCITSQAKPIRIAESYLYRCDSIANEQQRIQCLTADLKQLQKIQREIREMRELQEQVGSARGQESGHSREVLLSEPSLVRHIGPIPNQINYAVILWYSAQLLCVAIGLRIICILQRISIDSDNYQSVQRVPLSQKDLNDIEQQQINIVQDEFNDNGNKRQRNPRKFLKSHFNRAQQVKRYPLLKAAIKQIERASGDSPQKKLLANPLQSLKLLQEAIEFNAHAINELKLEKKNILVVLGDHGSGKSAILSSLRARDQIAETRKRRGASAKYDIISPQLAILPDSYKDEFCGLDRYSSFEFPPVFNTSSGTPVELDLALQLSLQKMLTQAKSAHVLLLISAQYFLPENLEKLTRIKERLAAMFQDPQKHVLVGITQAKELERNSATMYIPDDIYELLLTDYKVMRVEPEDVDGLQDLILELTTKQPPMKQYVNKCFIEQRSMRQILENMKEEISGKGALTQEVWFGYLESYLQRCLGRSQSEAAEFGKIGKAIQDCSIKHNNVDWGVINQVKNDLESYQNYLEDQSDFFEALAFPSQVNSILGIVPEYQFFETLISKELTDNPELYNGVLEFEFLIIDRIYETLLQYKFQHFKVINHTFEIFKVYLAIETQIKIEKAFSETYQTYQQEFEELGLEIPRDMKNQKLNVQSQISSFLRKSFSHVSKIPPEFKHQLEIIVPKILISELHCSDLALISLHHRKTRILSLQPFLSEHVLKLSLSSIIMDQSALESQLYQDHLNLTSMNQQQNSTLLHYTSLNQSGSPRKKSPIKAHNARVNFNNSVIGQPLMFSKTIAALLPTKLFKQLQLTITSVGAITLEDAKEGDWPTLNLDIRDLSALALIETPSVPNQSRFILKESSQTGPYNDQVLVCFSQQSGEQVCRIFRYTYWKIVKRNLPVYRFMEEELESMQGTDGYPMKYRAPEFDIYPENLPMCEMEEEMDLGQEQFQSGQTESIMVEFVSAQHEEQDEDNSFDQGFLHDSSLEIMSTDGRLVAENPDILEVLPEMPIPEQNNDHEMQMEMMEIQDMEVEQLQALNGDIERKLEELKEKEALKALEASKINAQDREEGDQLKSEEGFEEEEVQEGDDELEIEEVDDELPHLGEYQDPEIGIGEDLEITKHEETQECCKPDNEALNMLEDTIECNKLVFVEDKTELEVEQFEEDDVMIFEEPEERQDLPIQSKPSDFETDKALVLPDESEIIIKEDEMNIVEDTIVFTEHQQSQNFDLINDNTKDEEQLANKEQSSKLIDSGTLIDVSQLEITRTEEPDRTTFKVELLSIEKKEMNEASEEEGACQQNIATKDNLVLADETKDMFNLIEQEKTYFEYPEISCLEEQNVAKQEQSESTSSKRGKTNSKSTSSNEEKSESRSSRKEKQASAPSRELLDADDKLQQIAKQVGEQELIRAQEGEQIVNEVEEIIDGQEELQLANNDQEAELAFDDRLDVTQPAEPDLLLPEDTQLNIEDDLKLDLVDDDPAEVNLPDYLEVSLNDDPEENEGAGVQGAPEEEPLNMNQQHQIEVDCVDEEADVVLLENQIREKMESANHVASREDNEGTNLKRSIYLESEVGVIIEEDDQTHENLTCDSEIDELYIRPDYNPVKEVDTNSEIPIPTKEMQQLKGSLLVESVTSSQIYPNMSTRPSSTLEDYKMSTLTQNSHIQDQKFKLADFEILRVIGKGSFAKVLLVRNKKTQHLHAMKQMRKDEILKYDKLKDALMEKEILQEMNHPFVLGLDFCFQSETKVFFVMPFARGGDLFQHLSDTTNFSEARARRIALQLVLALGYLHSKNVVYRDLKPENVVVGEDGYVSLVDFGISKKLEGAEVTKSLCGTLEYLAPEMIKGAGHGFTLDWWTLGILTYEMVIGFPPFHLRQTTKEEHLNKLRFMILECEPRFPSQRQQMLHRLKISTACQDFIKQCLKKDPKERIGAKYGVEELLAHQWFAKIDKQKLLRKELKIPQQELPRLYKNPLDDRNFLSTKVDKSSLKQSFIDQKARKLIQQFEDQFKAFDC